MIEMLRFCSGMKGEFYFSNKRALFFSNSLFVVQAVQNDINAQVPDYKKLLVLLKKGCNDIRATNSHLMLKGKGSFQLPIVHQEPNQIPAVRDEFFILKGAVFKELVRLGGSTYIPRETLRPTLGSVNFRCTDKVLSVSSTDKTSASFAEMALDFEDFECTIDGAQLASICKMDFDEVVIHPERTLVLFQIDELKIYIRCVQGAFMKVQMLLSKIKTSLEFTLEEVTLREILAIASVVEVEHIALNMSSFLCSALAYNVKNTMEAEVDFPSDYEGEDFELLVPCKQLKRISEAFKGDLTIKTGTSARDNIVIKAESSFKEITSTAFLNRFNSGRK